VHVLAEGRGTAALSASSHKGAALAIVGDAKRAAMGIFFNNDLLTTQRDWEHDGASFRHGPRGGGGSGSNEGSISGCLTS
jgi:hypothetical protein